MMFDATDPLGRLAKHAKEPYPEQPTGWTHLVAHWQKAYDAGSKTDDELASDKTLYATALAETDDALTARKARYTGWLRAIADEQNQRKYGS
jgi:hypothetical protein